MVVNIFTHKKGRLAGVMLGGQSRKNAPYLQPGNLVAGVWRYKNQESLGRWSIESKRAWGSIVLARSSDLIVFACLSDMLMRCLPEGQVYYNLYKDTYHTLDTIASNKDNVLLRAIASYCLWEMSLLTELGFGFDIDGALKEDEADEVYYISPNTGKGAGRRYGARWKNKLLKIPLFLHRDGADIFKRVERYGGEASKERSLLVSDLLDALKLTGHFISGKLLTSLNKTVPQSRLYILSMLEKLD